MNISLPFRGLNVVPAAITQGQRHAVMFFYSGIDWASPAVASLRGLLLLLGAGQ